MVWRNVLPSSSAPTPASYPTKPGLSCKAGQENSFLEDFVHVDDFSTKIDLNKVRDYLSSTSLQTALALGLQPWHWHSLQMQALLQSETGHETCSRQIQHVKPLVHGIDSIKLECDITIGVESVQIIEKNLAHWTGVKRPELEFSTHKNIWEIPVPQHEGYLMLFVVTSDREYRWQISEYVDKLILFAVNIDDQGGRKELLLSEPKETCKGVLIRPLLSFAKS